MSQPLARRPHAPPAPLSHATPPPRESHVAATPARRLRVEAFGATDVGLLRPSNEDSFAVLPNLGLFMVADGVGGEAAGEVASRMVIEIVAEAFEDGDMTWPMTAGPEHRVPGARLLNAGLQRANTHIRGLASNDQGKAGMATTFAALLVLADRVVIAHVGDSRIYRLRGCRLDLLTEDHSLLNAFIKGGLWDPDSTDPFPQPNVITCAVGLGDTLEVDMRFDAPQVGDVYLICSDGLHGALKDDQEMATVLVKERDLTRAVGRLIEASNDDGGPDNITAVLVRVTSVGTS